MSTVSASKRRGDRAVAESPAGAGRDHRFGRAPSSAGAYKAAGVLEAGLDAAAARADFPASRMSCFFILL
jgi:hypothetical protein